MMIYPGDILFDFLEDLQNRGMIDTKFTKEYKVNFDKVFKVHIQGIDFEFITKQLSGSPSQFGFENKKWSFSSVVDFDQNVLDKYASWSHAINNLKCVTISSDRTDGHFVLYDSSVFADYNIIEGKLNFVVYISSSEINWVSDIDVATYNSKLVSEDLGEFKCYYFAKTDVYHLRPEKIFQLMEGDIVDFVYEDVIIKVYVDEILIQNGKIYEVTVKEKK